MKHSHVPPGNDEKLLVFGARRGLQLLGLGDRYQNVAGTVEKDGRHLDCSNFL